MLYLDASIVAGLVLHDRRFDAILASLPVGARFVVSDFGRGETIAAIAKRARAIRSTELRPSMTELDELLGRWLSIEIVPADVARAASLVARIEVPLRLPDAIHLAVCDRMQATLVTGDIEQARPARSYGLSTIEPPDRED